LDAQNLEADLASYTSLVKVDDLGCSTPHPHPPSLKGKPSQRKRRTKSSKRRKRADRRFKRTSKGITSHERKDALGADRFARLIDKPLNATLDFHPCHLDVYPTESLDVFFADLRNRISTWLRRKGIGTFWIWTQENYTGERREHLHIVLHLPVRYRAELEV